MTGTLILVIIILTVRTVYLEFQRSDQEKVLEGYRLMVLEWYSYLQTKQHGEDFLLWRKELDEEI
jgi:hypothetical protein